MSPMGIRVTQVSNDIARKRQAHKRPPSVTEVMLTRAAATTRAQASPRTIPPSTKEASRQWLHEFHDVLDGLGATTRWALRGTLDVPHPTAVVHDVGRLECPLGDGTRCREHTKAQVVLDVNA